MLENQFKRMLLLLVLIKHKEFKTKSADKNILKKYLKHRGKLRCT